jgi:hypothetical protein
MKTYLLPLLAALVAGILGILATSFLDRYGLYAMILPGGFVAMGATLFPSRSRYILPLACALYALAISLFTEWYNHPFLADPFLADTFRTDTFRLFRSFFYFLAHIPNLTPVTLLMIAAGTALAFFLPLSHARPLSRPETKGPAHR